MNPTPPDAITLDSIVRQSEDQVCADVEGEVAIMSIEKGNYYLLNQLGSHIWQLIEKPTRVADVCTTVLSEYEVEREVCEADVMQLMRDLLEQELIEVIDAAPE